MGMMEIDETLCSKNERRGEIMKILERRLLCGGFSRFESEAILRTLIVAVEDVEGVVTEEYLEKVVDRLYAEATTEEEKE